MIRLRAAGALFSLLFLALAQAAPAQPALSPAADPLAGIWLREQDPTHHHWQLHLTRSPDGHWTCTADQLTANLIYGCALTSTTNPISFDLPGTGSQFTGTLSGDTLAGTLHGPRGDTPFTFTRQPTAIAMADPHRFGALAPPTPDDLLRGSYGPARSNNDLLHYHLALRVDPVAQSIQGTNDVRFRMLHDGSRIQLELTPALTIDSITLAGRPLLYTRDERTLWITTPRPLRQGRRYTIRIAYHGRPVKQGRFGCFSFDKDRDGKPWITTACEGEGASTWWPNKDQWRDEPQDGADLDITVPTGLTAVSNGRFHGSRPGPDGYTTWRWRVTYPINSYDVALNIGNYTHFSGPRHGRTTLDFYVLPYDLEKAKKQFAQVPTMLDAYEHYFGEYPFARDGYKLVQVPYAGMEHQSAVAYGNHFENSYLGGDWTGVGISPRFDFIIIHESGHEWFGNSITAADVSDMWIHEGWTTYLEALYVEYRWGKPDAIRYVNGLKKKVLNERPIITPHDENAEPTQDQYFKGALMLNTLRSLIGDDTRWFADIHSFYQHFKYQDIMTEDVVSWWNPRTGLDLTPFFNQYLRHPSLPVLDLDLHTPGEVRYRWQAAEPAFAMPIDVGDPAHWTRVHPSTTAWQTIPWTAPPSSFQVATDLFYVNVDRNAGQPEPSRTAGSPGASTPAAHVQ